MSHQSLTDIAIVLYKHSFLYNALLTQAINVRNFITIMTDSIQHLIEPHIQDLGGFQARRLLPSDVLALVGPFIFFDHLGPAVFPPGRGVDVRPHPHINLAPSPTCLKAFCCIVIVSAAFKKSVQAR
jgi:hypothetical protein